MDKTTTLKTMTQILLDCDFCKIAFYRSLSYHNSSLKEGYKTKFCSKQCRGKHQTLINSIEIECPTCQNKCRKTGGNYRKSKRWFCSVRCANIYKNNNKITATKRSKLERYLEKLLPLLFPKIEILFNVKDVVGSELDIYIPKLKLAVELNGICHYKAIYGEKRLSYTQKNDLSKIEACSKQLITLVIIDTTKQKYFSSESSQTYLDTIYEIIKNYYS